jgi:hypothetical protein
LGKEKGKLFPVTPLFFDELANKIIICNPGFDMQLFLHQSFPYRQSGLAELGAGSGKAGCYG